MLLGTLFLFISCLLARVALQAEPGDLARELDYTEMGGGGGIPSSVEANDENALVETFENLSAKSKWRVSEFHKEGSGGVQRFLGKWNIEEPHVFKGQKGNMGLVVKSRAAHHAISYKLDKEFTMDGRPLVLQYEVKMQKIVECGGAYIKLISEKNFEVEQFNDKTSYSIMFGPDRCGSDNKVHFIFKHQNPLTRQYEEKHLDPAPLALITKLSTLYTLFLERNDFSIFINKEKVASGSLLEDFHPPVNPSKEIEDENCTDDWNKDAPKYIPDPSFVVPEGVLENEPQTIPNPNAKRPDTWNDVLDGEWKPNQVDNPKCKNGCGPIKVPLVRNPKYQPKMIPNPHYFEDKEPYKMDPVVGLGFELWTMQEDILFDNIYLGRSLEEAFKFANETWVKKYALEKLEEDIYLEGEEKNKSGLLNRYSLVGIREFANKHLSSMMRRVIVFLDDFNHNPIETVKNNYQFLAGCLFSVVLFIISVRYLISKRCCKKLKKNKNNTSKDSKGLDNKISGKTKKDVSKDTISDTLHKESYKEEKKDNKHKTERFREVAKDVLIDKTDDYTSESIDSQEEGELPSSPLSAEL